MMRTKIDKKKKSNDLHAFRVTKNFEIEIIL